MIITTVKGKVSLSGISHAVNFEKPTLTLSTLRNRQEIKVNSMSVGFSKLTA